MAVPRVQFTIRQMMVLVVVVASCAYAAVLKKRTDSFRQRVSSHSREWFKTLPCHHGPYNYAMLNRASSNYHLELILKYEAAAKHPWLPVDPDPPAPTLADIRSRK